MNEELDSPLRLSSGLRPDESGVGIPAEAGRDEPGVWEELDSGKMLADWGAVARGLGRVPGYEEYDALGRYDAEAVKGRFGSWFDVGREFKGFAACKPEWGDVVAFCAAFPAAEMRHSRRRKRRFNRKERRKREVGMGRIWKSRNQEKRDEVVGGGGRLNQEKEKGRPIRPVRQAVRQDSRCTQGFQQAGSTPSTHSTGSGLSAGSGSFAGRMRAVCGEPMEFAGMRNAPINEAGVVLLFGMLAERLGFHILSVRPEFPDCSALRKMGDAGWQNVAIEFEYQSSNFHKHGHAPNGCDIIVCWEHNWPDCPPDLEVIALSEEIKRLAVPG